MQVTVNAEPNSKSQTVRVQQVDVYQGGSLSMGMSWVRKDPDQTTLKAYMDEKQAKIDAILAKGKSLFLVLEGKSLVEIEALSKRAGVPFIDVAFPPSPSSLFACDAHEEGAIVNHSYATGFAMASDAQRPIAIEWRRPVEFQEPDKPYVLFDGDIEPADIKQGCVQTMPFLIWKQKNRPLTFLKFFSILYH